MKNLFLAVALILVGSKCYAEATDLKVRALEVEIDSDGLAGLATTTFGLGFGKDLLWDSSAAIPIRLHLNMVDGSEEVVWGNMNVSHFGLVAGAAWANQAFKVLFWDQKTLSEITGNYFGISVGASLFGGAGVRRMSNGHVALVSRAFYAGGLILGTGDWITLQLRIPHELINKRLVFQK